MLEYYSNPENIFKKVLRVKMFGTQEVMKKENYFLKK